jgi:hypothetical protein
MSQPQFIPGLDLNRHFFQQVVKPLLDEYFPGLKYAAGIVGEGSDVLRFDTPQSMDHNWGPHMRIFLHPKDFKLLSKKIDSMFRRKLPYEFMGFSTNFTKPNEDKYLVTQMKPIKSGSVNHLIQMYTVKSFFKHYLGYNPTKQITYQDWLLFPQQALIEVARGEIYYDTIDFKGVQEKFRYFPPEVWMYLYACQWGYIGDLELQMGRSGEIGDELGSNIIATKIVENIMKLCHLMEKKYWPYSKWFGTSFSRLKCAPNLTYMLLNTVAAKSWQERQEHLIEVYKIIAKMHNDLKITKPMPIKFNHGERSFQVIGARYFHDEIKKKCIPYFKDMKYEIGSIDQFISHARINHMEYVYWKFKNAIK